MSPDNTPLKTGLAKVGDTLTSPLWATHFWLTQAPYITPGEPHRRSHCETRVRIECVDDNWIVHFDCQGEGSDQQSGKPLRPLGDPDRRADAYVQVQFPIGEEGGCLHMSVTRGDQMISERFDKMRDPISGWTASAQETATGWSARITWPCAKIPAPISLRLARWVPGEGITRWPTPYGSWWHVDVRDFLVLTTDEATDEYIDSTAEVWMEQREADLFAAAGTPDPAEVAPEEWRTASRGFITAPLEAEGDFLRHLQHRVQQHPWLAFGTLPSPDIEACQGLLRNRVYFEDGVIELGPHPDWDSINGNLYIMAHATRFDFLVDLVSAYRNTGDVAYASGVIALIDSWLSGNDARQSLTPSRYPIRWAPRLIVSHRLVCMVRALYSLLATGLVSEHLLLKLFTAVREAAFLLSGDLSRLYPKNHSVIICDHMVQLSVLCAELTAAQDIRSEYFEHLRRALEVQFLPDGMQGELSTTYQIVCYVRVKEATDLCDKAGIEVPEAITNWRRRILGVTAQYLLPNGHVAAFNDGTMSGLVDVIGEEDSTLQDIVLRDAPSLGLEAALAIASCGKKGKPESIISHALPYAGHYILRDGLTPESMALAFDAGPFGIAHAHEDALSVMLVRYGKDLLIDIGSGAYDESGPMRRYTLATHSHSTICIDGEGQASSAFPRSWKRVTPWSGHHHFGREVQFAHGQYSNGYGPGGAIKVTHQRAVFSVNGCYVLLIDYLQGEGTHHIESHFAVAPQSFEVMPAGLRTTSGNGDIDISMVYPPGAQVSIACGQEEPFAGWMPHGGYGQEPHPRLTYQLEASLPCCLVTLLTPFQNPGEIPSVQITESQNAINMEIDYAGEVSTLTCSRSSLDVTLTHKQTRVHAVSETGEELKISETTCPSGT